MENNIYKIAITLIFAFICLPNLNAQSIHFSQNSMAPLITNPAYAGLFNGDIRVGGIYRSQWSSISQNGFKTTSVSTDAKIIKGVSEGDWISGGLTFYNDKAGTVSVNNNTLMLTGAYNINLNGQGKNYISIGTTFGISSQSLDLSQAQFDSQYSDGNFVGSSDIGEVINDERLRSQTISAGLMYYNITGIRNYYFTGFSLGQFNGIRTSRASETETNAIPIRVGVQAGISKQINEFLDIVPRAFLFNEAGAFKTDLLLGARYVFQENYNGSLNAFTFSTGMRTVGNQAGAGMAIDAIIFQASIEAQSVTVSAAFDANVSNLTTATNRNGAFEIAASYNIAFRQNMKGGIPAANCPRF